MVRAGKPGEEVRGMITALVTFGQNMQLVISSLLLLIIVAALVAILQVFIWLNVKCRFWIRGAIIMARGEVLE
jgi:hypothetical protein